MKLTNDIQFLKDRLSEQGRSLSDLIFLTVGKMQVGKSSVINSIVGRQVAEIGINIDAETKKVKAYQFEVESIGCKVYDTPGFFDGLNEVDNNEKYIEQIRKHVSEFHCLLFVSRLSDPFSADEVQTIRLISEVFTAEVWKNAVVVFTFADHYPDHSEYKKRLNLKSNRFKAEVAKYYRGALGEMPFIGVDNTSLLTPDDETWKDKLITAIFTKVKDNGFIPMLIVTAGHVVWTNRQINYNSILADDEKSEVLEPKKNEKNDSSKVFLSEEQMKRISDRAKTSSQLMDALGNIGGLIGNFFGEPGKIVGKALGYISAAILWILSKR